MAKPLSVCVSFHMVPTTMAVAFSKLVGSNKIDSKYQKRKPDVSVTYTRGRSIEAAKAMLREVHSQPKVMA